MGETRGAATIVDRVEGWGHEDATDANREDDGIWGSPSGNAITATDASKEATATRLARLVATRNSEAPADGAVPSWDDDNVAMTDSHTEASAANRTADSRNTVQLNDANDTKREEAQRASILDRTDGWGHKDGSFTYRKDS